jgi:hypothetical protein
VKRYALVLMTLMSLLTAGCGVLRSVEPGAAPEPWVRTGGPLPVSDSESLLMYFEYVRKLSAADLAKEHDTARQRYARTRSDFNRVRYAMLLSVPGSAFSDDARALDALEPLLGKPDTALHSLAFMVGAQIQEQRRAQGLQQKLDALKSLEKSLIERGHKP